LKKVLDRYRPGGVDLTGKDFSEVEKSILAGKPVVAWITINYKAPKARYWKTPAGKSIYAPTPLHCVVITGIDKDYVYINDSETAKKDVKIAKSAFISIYNAMGKRALTVN